MGVCGTLDAQVLVKAAAALGVAAFALVVVLAGRKRSRNLFLAAFLAMIAGNLAADALRSAFHPFPALIDLERSAFQISIIFSALDPAFLYMFATAGRRATGTRATLVPAIATAPGFALALAVPFAGPQLGGSPGMLFHLVSAYIVVIYTLVLVVVLRQQLRPNAPGVARYVAVGVALAAVPRWALSAEGVVRISLGIVGMAPDRLTVVIAALIGLTVGLFIVVLWIVLSRTAPVTARRWALAGIAGGALLAVVLYGDIAFAGARLAGWTDRQPPRFSSFLALVSAPIRWLLFTAFASIAVLRFEPLSLTIRGRRRAARILVTLGVGFAAILLLGGASALAGRTALEFRSMDMVLLAALLLASQGSRRFVDRVAERLYGVPIPGDRPAAVLAYERAAEEAARQGRVLGADRDLARLRDELGLDQRTAGVLEHMAVATDQGPISPGRRVGGRYEVVRLLGRGTGGRVFLARDDVLARDVVLKELVVGDGSGARAALREARLVGGLQHPNVVTVFDVIERSEGPIIVAEYIRGGSLADHIDRHGRLAPDAGATLLDGILAGLEAVHAQGIIHRDLKPANVLLTEEGAPKIADFGVARGRQDATAQAGDMGLLVGTPRFMAPEIRRGERPTPASDVWAVGRIGETCIAGTPPAAVKRALRERPDERWSEAAEMRRALAAAPARRSLEDGV